MCIICYFSDKESCLACSIECMFLSSYGINLNLMNIGRSSRWSIVIFFKEKTISDAKNV